MFYPTKMKIHPKWSHQGPKASLPFHTDCLFASIETKLSLHLDIQLNCNNQEGKPISLLDSSSHNPSENNPPIHHPTHNKSSLIYHQQTTSTSPQPVPKRHQSDLDPPTPTFWAWNPAPRSLHRAKSGGRTHQLPCVRHRRWIFWTFWCAFSLWRRFLLLTFGRLLRWMLSGGDRCNVM